MFYFGSDSLKDSKVIRWKHFLFHIKLLHLLQFAIGKIFLQHGLEVEFNSGQVPVAVIPRV